ncbi:MAG: hypothetical protein PHV85_10590, partial [Desulfovibrionaceae bacterium]|nr:hypothetical protein [Desulfovibrionaceae bacterium]
FAAIGIYAGVKSWWGNQVLVNEKKALEQRLVEAEVRLERLGNIEKILNSYDPKELQALLSATPNGGGEAGLDLGALFASVNTMQVGVENLKVQVEGGRLNVGFDLNNMQGAAPLSGSADLSLVRNDGGVVDPVFNKNDLSFQIQRFKHVRTEASLPKGVEAKGLFGLRLEIKSDDGQVIYSETYPLQRIRP